MPSLVRIAPLALFALFVTACQTTSSSDQPLTVPMLLQPLFSPCSPGDGAVSMQLFNGGKLAGSAEVEWLAKPNGDWDIEVINAVGLTMLRVAKRDKALTTEGELAAHLPKLGLSKGGFLVVDGERIGLRASEVPCLLGYHLPRPWLGQLRAVASDPKTDGGRIDIDASDAVRDIDVSATELGKRRPGRLCMRFAWRRYLIFRPSLTWCQGVLGAVPNPVPGGTEATLTGFADYMLKWVRIDEH